MENGRQTDRKNVAQDLDKKKQRDWYGVESRTGLPAFLLQY